MRPGAAILSRLMMMMFLLLVLRLECCSKYDCLLATPFTELRRVSSVVEEVSRRVDPHDAARENLGVVEERLERCLGGQRTYCVWPRRVLDRVVGYDERASPARRLVRRGAVEQIRVRE